MKVRVCLREKITSIESEVKKLEKEIKKGLHDKKTREIKQGVHRYGDKSWDYHRELIRFMPWIGPFITKGITHGGTL